MTKITLNIVLLLFLITSFSQDVKLLKSCPSDIPSAIPLILNASFQLTMPGSKGKINDLRGYKSSDIKGLVEKNSLWYSVDVKDSGRVELRIIPTGEREEDLDFVIFSLKEGEDYTSIWNGDIDPLAFNFSKVRDTTGLTLNSKEQFTSDKNGNTYNFPLEVGANTKLLIGVLAKNSRKIEAEIKASFVEALIDDFSFSPDFIIQDYSLEMDKEKLIIEVIDQETKESVMADFSISMLEGEAFNGAMFRFDIDEHGECFIEAKAPGYLINRKTVKLDTMFSSHIKLYMVPLRVGEVIYFDEKFKLGLESSLWVDVYNVTALAELLVSEEDFKVVLTGGKDDSERIKRISKALFNKGVSLSRIIVDKKNLVNDSLAKIKVTITK
jgi:hypothetical protein